MARTTILRCMNHPSDGRWETLGREYLYRNPWCAFRVDAARLPNGEELDYGVLEAGGFAAVVPVTDEGRVILVRQWRQPVGCFALELPGGGVCRGEDAVVAARRELLEETGYRAEGLTRLLTVHTSPGRSNETCHLFRCRAVRELTGPRPEPTEYLNVVELTLDEAFGKVIEADVSAATTVLGLFIAAREPDLCGGLI